MDNHSPEEARLAFSDAYCLWRLEPNVVADLIDAATGCLVAGLDTPLLCELAGVSPRESAFVLAPLADGAIDELGLRESIADNVDQAALATMLRRVVTGRMIPSELTRWAHQHIGHDGDPRCQVFVDLDDRYDTVEYTGFTIEDLDRYTIEEAEAFLEGRPALRRADEFWRAIGATSPPPPRPSRFWRQSALWRRLRR